MNPLVEDLTQKSLDDLLKVTNDLHKKLGFMARMGNANMVKPKSSTTYTVFGTDLWGCQNSSSVLISVYPLPTLQISSSNSIACIGERVQLSASGANSYTWNSNYFKPQLQYVATSPMHYTITGKNSLGCSDTTEFLQPVQSCSVALRAEFETSDVSCESRNDARIQVTSTVLPRIASTQYAIEYQWQGTDRCPSNNCSYIENLPQGTYTLTMIVYSKVNAGYERTDTLIETIQIKDLNPPCPLQPYHGITANNDQINDCFHIDNIDVYPNNRVEIYNRWGALIKKIDRYDNTQQIWPSPEESQDLQSGTYFYIIFTGDSRVSNLKGWIELLK